MLIDSVYPFVESDIVLRRLQGRIDGRVLRPDQPGWVEAIRIWNGRAVRIPALVVQPATAADVVTAVEFARDHAMLLSVRGGGHSLAGTAMADGAVALDMSRMCEVRFDAPGRRVSVGPGCLLGDVDRATQEHGLATVLGLVSQTGVAGLTLGGGFGYLTRQFGWTVDNLVEVVVEVTVDGP